MKTLTYTIHLEPADEGGFTVTVPSLPGCVTEGDSYEEAIEMARDAIRLYVESLIEDGEVVPVEKNPRQILDLPVQVQLAIPA
ncbi:type II toxin-antitoxin system HicB family antitoxin [Candidatus Sumerlaeota bacterium]|nr:type II toxin-antitoxin system HicB family antitoxin [Candidatus Sumerlaeota bacterium]